MATPSRPVPSSDIVPFVRFDGAPSIVVVPRWAGKKHHWLAYAAVGGRNIEAIRNADGYPEVSVAEAAAEYAAAAGRIPMEAIRKAADPVSDIGIEEALAQASDVSRWTRREPDRNEQSRSAAGMRAIASSVIGRAEAADFLAVCGSAAARSLGHGFTRKFLDEADALVGARSVDAFFDRWPVLFFHLFDRASRAKRIDLLVDAIGADDETLATLLAEGMPPVLKDPTIGRNVLRTVAAKLLAGLRGEEVGIVGFDYAIWLGCRVPVDWLPRTASEFRPFHRIAGPVLALSRAGLSPATLTASSKGRWREFVGRVLPNPRQPSMYVTQDAEDMCRTFRDQLVVPALKHGLAFGSASAEQARIDGVRRSFGRIDPKRFDPHCFRILLGSKSLPALVKTTADWHRARPSMDLAIGGATVAKWPIPFEERALGDGLLLKPIGDSETLREEGAQLNHCVGGYARRCSEGSCVIASLVRIDADGGGIRSSTVELSAWYPDEPWSPSVVQHRSRHNGVPDAADAAAVAEFVESLRACPHTGPGVGDGNFATNRDAQADLAAGYDWTDADGVETAFRQWRRFLPHDVSSTGTRWFSDHAEELLGDDFAGVTGAIAGDDLGQKDQLAASK